MKIHLLHIVLYDPKFFGTIKWFLQESRFKNEIIAYVKGIPFQDQNTFPNVAVLTTKKELEEYIKTHNYDAVFFHSMFDEFVDIVRFIPHDKKIIWWSWGYDIYSTNGFKKPILPIKLYLPLTKQLFEERHGKLIGKLQLYYEWARNFLFGKNAKKLLNRVDYFQPVLSIEYERIKQKYPTFKAEEFYYPNSFGNDIPDIIQLCKDDGDILLGNSATYTNNHVDVWQSIYNSVPEGQKVIVPLNYGAAIYAKQVKSVLKYPNLQIINDFLQKEKYQELINQCSYFVVGCMRQQAMGNVSICIKKGIKVFAYRDSLIYKGLKNIGCIVFAIEDIDKDSFRKALSFDEVKHNIECYRKERQRREKVLEEFFMKEDINH